MDHGVGVQPGDIFVAFRQMALDQGNLVPEHRHRIVMVTDKDVGIAPFGGIGGIARHQMPHRPQRLIGAVVELHDGDFAHLDKNPRMGSYTGRSESYQACRKSNNASTGLGIQLPSPPVPVASYVPYTISGKLVIISGQIPVADGKPQFIGKLGADISLEDGKKAARLCALNLLAQLKAACGGDLDRVKALRAAGRVRQCHARFHPASGSRQWRLGFDCRRCSAMPASMPAPRWAPVRCRAAWRWKWKACSRLHELNSARLAASAAEIGARRLERLRQSGRRAPIPHPFTRYEFFAALEESGSAVAETGWQPCHLVLERDGRIASLMPLYLKNHSQGEYVFDHAWADALERAGGDYYPKLQARVPFTPVTGRRLAGAQGGDAARAALLEAGKRHVQAAQGVVAAHHLS